MSYEPAGDPSAFDAMNDEQLQAWLDHPNVKAAAEEMGREFRAKPPAVQIAELGRALLESTERRDDLMALVAKESVPKDDPRRALALQFENEVGAMAMRIKQVADEVLAQALGTRRER